MLSRHKGIRTWTTHERLHIWHLYFSMFFFFFIKLRWLSEFFSVCDFIYLIYGMCTYIRWCEFQSFLIERISIISDDDQLKAEIIVMRYEWFRNNFFDRNACPIYTILLKPLWRWAGIHAHVHLYFTLFFPKIIGINGICPTLC